MSDVQWSVSGVMFGSWWLVLGGRCSWIVGCRLVVLVLLLVCVRWGLTPQQLLQGMSGGARYITTGAYCQREDVYLGP